MIILVDMDDVLAEFERGVIDNIVEKHPDKKDLFKKDRKEFNLKEEYPELKDLIGEIVGKEGIVHGLEPVKGSIKALKELEEKGHDVFICTSPLTDYRNNVFEKYKWVDENLGQEWVRKIILTKDKTLIKGDILIDDKPVITGKTDPTWEHVIFDRPYNKHIKDKKRMNWDNWKEVLEL